jgi:hypothetical protein
VPGLISKRKPTAFVANNSILDNVRVAEVVLVKSATTATCKIIFAPSDSDHFPLATIRKVIQFGQHKGVLSVLITIPHFLPP